LRHFCKFCGKSQKPPDGRRELAIGAICATEEGQNCCFALRASLL
jgi:hypothetical protein